MLLRKGRKEVIRMAKKWGSIGAPHSAARKRHLARIRPKSNPRKRRKSRR